MPSQTLDRKGLFSFLVITFALTYGIELALILSGFRVDSNSASLGMFAIYGVMWVPGLAALATMKLITREGLAIARIRFGSWRPYLWSALVIPLCFLLIYSVSWLVGLGQPDWQMAAFLRTFASAPGSGRPPEVPPAGIVLPALFVATTGFAPFVNGVFGFGEELGWRGYLLPKLMPLGKPRAYLILGIVWALWHLPLILVGFTYPGQPLLGFLAFMLLTTVFGVFLNEITLRYDSSVLAGWAHGVFNSQKLGLWAILFPSVNPILGGYAGLVGIVVWACLAFLEVRRGTRARVG